jgi:peptide/nickel transport system ATP-binding protein
MSRRAMAGRREMTTAPLLTCENLNVCFGAHHVLKNASIDIRPGETVGLVGESGSGKTTIGRAILGIGPVTSGRILFDGEDITGLAPRDRKGDAARIQAVFQDPYSSLNPAMTIEQTLTEPMVFRGLYSPAEARERVRDLLEQVALPADAAHRFPREFSGGQRQRVAIARALALSPRLVVCDEPVSALDLSTQARVMDLFIEIQNRTGVAYLFVSHDLAVVRHISHRVAVMRSGEIVEFGACDQVTSNPQHPYTQRLLLAAPVADPVRQAERRRAFESLNATR